MVSFSAFSITLFQRKLATIFFLTLHSVSYFPSLFWLFSSLGSISVLISLSSSISESALLCHFPRTKKVKLTDTCIEEWKKEKQPVRGGLEVWLHRLPGFADLVRKHYADFLHPQRAYSCQGFEMINYRDGGLVAIIENFFFLV